MAREYRRRLVHASGAVIPGAYVVDTLWNLGVVTWTSLRIVAIIGIGLAFILEFLRLYAGLEWRVFEQLTRDYEQDSLAGYALYVIGGGIAILVFEPNIAVPALFMLTIADPISGLLSRGGLKRMKSPYVMAIMFLICVGLAWPFVPPLAAVCGGIAATLADGFKPVVFGYVIDDNVSIPLSAAGAMWLLLWIL